MTAIVWYRRDLRMHEHPALNAALEGGADVIPFFCIDPALLGGRFASGSRTQFLLDTLADLDRGLGEAGSALVLRVGDPLDELVALAEQVGADTVHATVDAGPYARRRDREAGERLSAAGVLLRGHAGLFCVDDLDQLRTQGGRPFQVFTPFYRAWIETGRRPARPAPAQLPPLPAALSRGSIPTLADLGLATAVSDAAAGGEHAGLARWHEFRDGALSDYDSGRNDLAADGSSRLSAYLHFGAISPRLIESELADGIGAEEFRRQLAWRDFYAQVLRDFPANLRHEHQSRYRDRITWNDSEEDFERWCTGTTGYPLVDAGMRQLAREGWMHNRARLVVGSFLTKELGIDWRRGERFFMTMLVDGDVASNNGNWQWIASVGVDPQPITRRILSPSRQQERFDPTGGYVRRYVPELSTVPDEFLVEPWKMSAAQQSACGCLIGQDYPEPMVDRREARTAALERYGAAAALR